MVSSDLSTPSCPETNVELAKENHRTRTRNRCKLSCLSCYASKRKCDRQRPCTRCIRMGLTGLCVYEIEDPSSRDRGQLDENTRLRRRIAELESVVREMKNQPHPRWTVPGGIEHNPNFIRPQRRGPSRRVKADSGRSSSVDAFFASIADSADDDIKVKVEEDAFVPEFTPSESASACAGPSRSRLDSPLTAFSSRSHESPKSISIFSSDSSAGSPVSAPFTFGDEAYCDAAESLSSLSNFVQRSRHDSVFHDSMSSKSQTERRSPTASESSEEGPPLAILFPPTDSSSSQSPQLASQESLARRATVGIQTSPFPSASLPVFLPSHHTENEHDDKDCRCLVDPSVYNPLVFFASALRTSREALDVLHPSVSNCILFRRIVELDHHIFSAPPPSPRVSPVHRNDGSSISNNNMAMHPLQEPTFTPSSPPSRPIESPIRHPHLHSLPLYTHPCQQEDWGYVHDASEPAYNQVRGWNQH